MEASVDARGRASSARVLTAGLADHAVLVLVAAITAMLLQATRVFLSYMVFIVDQAERVQLGMTAGLVFLAVGLGALWPRLIDARRLMLFLAGGIALARIALQFWVMPEARMWLAAAIIILAGWAIPSLLTRSRADAAYGFGVGLALDLAIRIGRDSVDLPFIPTISAHGLTLVLAMVTLVAVIALPPDGRSTRSPGSAVAALAIGPALALHHLATGNLGLVQVQMDTSLTASAWLLAAGAVLGLGIDRVFTGTSVASDERLRAARLVTPTLIMIGALGLLAFWQDRAGLAGVGLVLGVAASIALTVSALRCGSGETGVTATALWLTAGMILQAAVLFIYFSATGLPLLVAGIFGVVAIVGLLVRRRPAVPATSSPASLASFASIGAILLAATLVATVDREDTAASTPLPQQFTVMTYNIQAGFSRDNHWNLETTARVIEAADPDVVILQEVGRGWPIMAGVDQARWLSHRLNMQLVWGPASRDELWGNAILTRAPILETEHIKYDTTENLQRGAVRAVLASESGPVTVIATHLDNPGDADDARQAQIAQLLALWNGVSPAVIGGDFNAEPESIAISTLVEAGLVDTGAVLGPAATTSERGRRIDYVLVTPNVSVIDARIPDTWASDHRPFVAQVQINP